jgi:hypothetical protein
MKVYRPGSKGVHRVFAQPGNEHPETTDFMQDGKPILFTVEFKDGVAEVPWGLGRYLLDQRIAFYSPLILPDNVNANRIPTSV